MISSSEYIEQERKTFALYTLTSRAIPAVTDGLKPSGRRTLWVARKGDKWKTATLAGATMPIHPHDAPSGAINTLAAPYGNNVPLFDGSGAFGTLLDPTAYGAPRYTTVKVSSFTKDVLFADIEIIPMMENYDSTELEPRHFLPLVPVVLLNPTEGIAVGFACNILPRSLKDIITAQLNYLDGTKNKELVPKFEPTKSVAYKDGTKWVFESDYEMVSANTIKVTKLPFGITHEQFTNHLYKLEEAGEIVEINDESKNVINITITFQRAAISGLSKKDLVKKLNLNVAHSENINVLNFDGASIWSAEPLEIVERFTEWRLGWYKVRYERLLKLITEEIQRLEDILTAIKNNAGSAARSSKNKAEFEEFLKEIEIVNTDYIATLPVYRFTEEEKVKTQKLLAECLKTQAEYVNLLKHEKKRRDVYKQELADILKRYA